MSVLIQGMEMPDPGSYLIRLYVREDGSADIWGVGTYVPKEPLPVVPVPPHGRLIDADALVDKHKTMAYEDGGRSYSFHATAKAWVEAAPTIIPADPAEEGE